MTASLKACASACSKRNSIALADAYTVALVRQPSLRVFTDVTDFIGGTSGPRHGKPFVTIVATYDLQARQALEGYNHAEGVEEAEEAAGQRHPSPAS